RKHRRDNVPRGRCNDACLCSSNVQALKDRPQVNVQEVLKNHPDLKKLPCHPNPDPGYSWLVDWTGDAVIECPLLAQSRHELVHCACLLLTQNVMHGMTHLDQRRSMSAFGPKQHELVKCRSLLLTQRMDR